MRPIIVISRASTNWDIKKENYKETCSLYHPNSFKDYSQLIDYFESIFSCTFFEYRKIIADITYAQWSKLNVDAIFKNEFNLKNIISSFDENTLILPCDDDDWISPELIDVLKETKENVINWSILRLFCNTDNRIHKQNAIPFPTNGYAISVKEFKKHDDYRNLFIWHLCADKNLKSELTLNETYNISIKNPTSSVTFKNSKNLEDYQKNVRNFSNSLKLSNIKSFQEQVDLLIQLQEKYLK